MIRQPDVIGWLGVRGSLGLTGFWALADIRGAPGEMRGFFAPLRMTSKSGNCEGKQQIPFGDDKPERQVQRQTQKQRQQRIPAG